MQQRVDDLPLLHILSGRVYTVGRIPWMTRDRRHHGKVSMQNKTLWIGVVAAVLLCGCAVQEDIYTLDHRLSALERRNLELEKSKRDQRHQGEEMELRGQYAEQAAQVQALQEEVRSLSGRFEEIEYMLDQKLKGYGDNQLKNQERMDRLAADVAAAQKRLDVVNQYLNLNDSQTQKPAPPAPASPAPSKTVSPPASDTALYDQAKKLLDEGNLKAAREGFEKLITTYPKSNNADNAQYWIAETYYQEKWYEKAILEYQKVIENYPTGNKVPAAMLKQAYSFLSIGETNNARLMFKTLIDMYPSTDEAGQAKRKLESL